MKETEFQKKIKKENRYYMLMKLKSYLLMKLSWGEKKKKREYTYQMFDQNMDTFFDKEKNDLPDTFYYKPTDILVYDLVAKEDLNKTKNGLLRLFREKYSHKFLPGSRTEQDIDELVDGINRTLHSGNSWYHIGRFDFEDNEELKSLINYFEVNIRNFSSSYAAIEMRIALAEECISEFERFIKNNYKKPGMCIHKHFGKNKKKSGSKISIGISGGVASENAKSQIWYEQLQYIKYSFLKEMKRYFPMILYSHSEKIYGINVFETNITPDDKLSLSVYEALGIDEHYGFNLSYAERLYILTHTVDFHDMYKSDMIYIYNPNLLEDYDMFCTPHNKAVHGLTMDYLHDLYRGLILKNYCIRYMDLIGDYRNTINKCGTNSFNYRKLLKIKYNFTRDFYVFQKINDELPVKSEFEAIEDYLKNNDFAVRSISGINHRLHPYKLFYGNPKSMWKQIKSNYDEVISDINRKIDISASLVEYKSQQRINKMTYVQVLIALATFILLIFPEKATAIASFILKIIGLFIEI